MLLTALGLAVELIVSLLATPVLQSMLINLPAIDLVTFAGVSGLLIVITLWLLSARAPRDANQSACHPSRRVVAGAGRSAFEGASSLPVTLA